ncbi:cytochrome c-type biogenesis protein CcmH, partial [Vibrio rotiferianus]
MRKLILAAFAALTFSLAAHAAIEVYEFDNL